MQSRRVCSICDVHITCRYTDIRVFVFRLQLCVCVCERGVLLILSVCAITRSNVVSMDSNSDLGDMFTLRSVKRVCNSNARY